MTKEKLVDFFTNKTVVTVGVVTASATVAAGVGYGTFLGLKTLVAKYLPTHA